jgi:hypothetical protein
VADNGKVPSPDAVAANGPKRLRGRGLVGVAGDLALAAIGILGILSDEAEALYERSIERGQDDVRRVQERLGGLGQSVLSFPRDGSPAPSTKRSKPSQRALDEWRDVLVRLNLPTATDVHVLTQQVAELEAQIERLTSERL